MFALNDLDASTQERDATAGVGNGRVLIVILVLFVLAATLSAMRKDVTQGFDELAHASYVAQLQRSGALWPDLNDLRMLEPASFRFTGEPNYLNHPSPYYVLLARLGPTLEGHPEAIVVHRLFNVALVTLGLAALLALGLVARLPRFSFYAYAVPLVCIPVLAPLAGSINNDNAAFAGGGIATLAAFQLLARGSRAWLIGALVGVVIAAWAKLTALLLVGGMAGGVLLWLIWRGQFRRDWILPTALATVLAAAPYIAFAAQYGSPAPFTSAVVAMLKSGAQMRGWDSAARMSFAAFGGDFVETFLLQWMPILTARTAVNDAALIFPIAAILCAVAGIALSVRRVTRAEQVPADIVIAAAAVAFVVTFAIHLVFSYQRHVVYGWPPDAFPRYYLPLAVLVPLACMALLAAIGQRRVWGALVGFLIAGPIVFRLFGAPLG